MQPVRSYDIGVDVGGTHTDVVVTLTGRSSTARRSRPRTTSRSACSTVWASSRRASASPLSDLLGDCRRIVNGTTVVTNAVTQLRGRPVGVLVTRGFRDTFRIARGPRLNVFDDHAQTNVPTIVPWDRSWR